MKIAIFEKEHFEGAFPVIKLFDRPGNEITIYTEHETLTRFNDLFKNEATGYRWIVLPNKSKLRFFYSLYKELKKQKPGILYINTISDNHLLYAFVLWLLQVKKVILTVHDINCLFESQFEWSPKKTLIHWGKKWLTRQVHEFNVVSDTMIPSLKSKVKQKKIHAVPGSVFENQQSPQVITGALRIVIPGTVDKKRRDYEQVFELAALANIEKLHLELILLGGYTDQYGASIIARATSLDSFPSSISVYDMQTVNQQEFDRQLDNAHFIWIPSVINTNICGDIPEVYGLTKSSGNIFDVIKHAKPFIVPENLTIPDMLQTSCYKYKSLTQLPGFFKTLTEDPENYEGLQKRALLNSRMYSIPLVRERNADLFNPSET